MDQRMERGNIIPQDFLISVVPRKDLTDEGYAHYVNVLRLILDGMMNGTPNGKFVESCCKEDWSRAESIADTRNKEAIEKSDLFKKFISYIKKHPSYIQKVRNEKLNTIIH